MNDFLGKAVVDGVMRYGSVSAVKTFDHGTRGGCPRRWWFSKIGGKSEQEREASRKAKDKGIKLDAELKNFLRTGDKSVSSLALKGLHILDVPGPDLKIDVKIHRVEQTRPLPIVHSQLTAAGIPFVGELDYAHERGRYRDDDGEHYDDPPETVEVVDIKFKSNAKDRAGNSTLMLPTELYRDIQMAGYGVWVSKVRPQTQHVRLSHAYFPEKGALPTKVTRLHVIDDCHRTWEYVEGVVRSMADVAKETNPDRVPGNTASCDAFAGCPHREYCNAYRSTSLDALYGKIATDFVQETPVGLLSNNPQIMQNAPAQQAPQPQQPQQAVPDMRAQLAAEEAAMRQQVAQQQQQMPQQINMQQLAEVCSRMGTYGFGFPSLGGNVAQAYAALGGQQVPPGFVYQGIPAPAGARRSLHQITLMEPAHIFQLEGELARERATQTPDVPPQAVPQQYASPTPIVQAMNPGYAVSPAPAHVQQPTFGPPATPVAGGILPPGTPESMPQLAQQQAPALQTHAANIPDAPVEPEAPVARKKSPGRPKKNQDAAPGAVAQATQTAAAPQTPSPSSSAGVATQVTPAAESAIPVTKTPGMPASASSDAVSAYAESGAILINARFAGRATKSLAPYVDYINAELSKRYSVTADGKPGIQDVRCVPKDSPLAFGGWKGAVREVVKADPPPPDAYHLDTFMDELNEAVADALRVVAEQRGWIYVRAVRG